MDTLFFTYVKLYTMNLSPSVLEVSRNRHLSSVTLSKNLKPYQNTTSKTIFHQHSGRAPKKHPKKSAKGFAL